MPTVLVHGSPETSAVWRDLVPRLRERGVDDVVLLSPPGFGAPVPDGFGGTATDHRDWLAGRLEEIGEPVDALGHDWGAGHLFAVAADRPDLLRTWAADCAGLLHPDYTWHPGARAWQTPGDGERRVAETARLGADGFARRHGIPRRLAADLARGFDDVMGRAVLALYRSAEQPYLRLLGDRLAAAARRPALLVHPTADAYAGPQHAPAVAGRLGARLATLDGAGHWWMAERPDEAADALVRFWAEPG